VREQERVQPVELGELVEHLRRPGEHDRRGHRPDRHVRQRRREHADRHEPEHRHRDVQREQQGTAGVRPTAHLGAGQQRDGADREQHGTDRRTDQHHQQRRGQAERDGTGELHQDEPHAARRCDEQVADRALAGLARDGVPGDHADGQRQEERDRNRQCGERDEQAVVGDVAEERRTAVVAVGGELHGDRDQDRHERERPEHRPGAATPEHQREFGTEQCERALPAADGQVAYGRIRLRHRIPLR
jgi:hypothetical protein